MRRAAAVAWAALAACAVDPAANPARRCAVDVDCGPGGACHRGFCVPADADGGPAIGDGAVARADGGDAGDGAADAGSVACDEDATPTVPCYSGPAGTATVGECHAGFRVCVAGTLSARCFQERVPTPELRCSGLDEACNGPADEAPAFSCSTGRRGICAEGVEACVDGEARCVQTRTATIEACNSEDDDCNGVADDLGESCYPAATAGCAREPDGRFTCVGQCRPGVATCSGGCEGAVVPGGEVCTGTAAVALDENCDGRADEGCACAPGDVRACYTGPAGTLGNGPCTSGTARCVGGAAGPCEGEVVPGTETCANLGRDDDCDDVPDDVPGTGVPCTTAALGRCGQGTVGCRGGRLECITLARQDEVCNGEDDDCDGEVDDGFVLTSTTHCTRCGNACAAGEICCAAGCVNPATDPRYCGSCTESCGANLACCGGECIDPNTDRDNCGGCGTRVCAAGQECCGGQCVATQADEANCGACARACGAGAQCCGGDCHAPNDPACTGCATVCTGNEVCCAPVATVCSDPMTDELHCGGCDRPACVGDRLCCGGACVPRSTTHCSGCGVGCPMGSLCCNGGCVANGPNNCNTCGTTCAGATPNCCPSGCTNTQTDELNCGGCGAGPCAAPNSNCCGGRCVNPNNTRTACGPSCDDCTLLFGVLGRCVNGRCSL